MNREMKNQLMAASDADRARARKLRGYDKTLAEIRAEQAATGMKGSDGGLKWYVASAVSESSAQIASRRPVEKL